ncbi:kelch-like protein 8 [Paramacrobiotus metropolitanus]|uniref:kelch-like protein 8 n=1 Tax=Paramacrobiotus metropolitanus TaxID=2943436 RepID=UPI002445A9FD|nr:kelch-like protein 8 [Paramacrobiotus metropolitanus]
MSKRKRSANHPVHGYLAAELVRQLRDLQSTGMFCDVVLKGSEKSAVGIPCHRAVLSAHSVYFRAAFTENWKDSTQPVFQLHNIDSRTLNELVKYFYTLDIKLNNDNVESILIAAQFLQMTPLAELCWEHVDKHMQRSDSLAVYILASQHDNPDLAEKTLEDVWRHFPTFAQCQDFLQMDAQQVRKFHSMEEHGTMSICGVRMHPHGGIPNVKPFNCIHAEPVRNDDSAILAVLGE